MNFARVILLLLLALGGVRGVTAAEESRWRLVWQDDFERPELGTNWFARKGSARIVDGRLELSGTGATLLIERSFGPDVKIEFVAEANPARPPCDLSATLCANRLYGWFYLYAFGGNNNQWNQLLGCSDPQRDRSPRLLIQHGRKYRLGAIKEGSRLTYAVDGEIILEARDEDPLGGPGFDRVGLVTWNGMLVDYVKVYERTTPAAEQPPVIVAMPDIGYRWENRQLSFTGATSASLEPAIAAYNSRRYRQAIELFAALNPPTRESVAGLAWVLGDLACDERPADQQTLATLAARVAKDNPQDPRCRDFALAAEWFQRVTLKSRDRRAVTRLVSAGPENNPFYHKAELYRARYHHASAKEGADGTRLREALEMFQRLEKLWPDHAGLAEFSGRRIPWGPEYIRPEADGPEWARALQEALARQHAILEWWFTQRQEPDGQLGGGWGDDVEILRSWVPVAAITTAGETTLAGIERLADGVWRHVLKDGYDPGVGDVEHSAEPSADPLPPMLLLRYGDPLWVERNLRSAKTIREKFMDLNRQGRLQFVSSEFGTDGVNRHPRAGGDTGYHQRPMRHLFWLGWYGVEEARQTWLQWADTWRDATVRQTGNKPPGFPPASVFFPEGGIEPPSGRAWYDDASHYYGFPGLPLMVHEVLLGAAYLGHDRKYLEPTRAMLRLATAGPILEYDPTLPGDHLNNLRARMVHMASPDIISVYRWMTGDKSFDDFALRRLSAYQRYLIDGDLARYQASLSRLADSLRHRWTQRTIEVIQTDRAGLEGAETVLSAYTGALRDFRDAAAPTLAVTWITPDLEFAALVAGNTTNRLDLLLYNFHPNATRFGLRPWQIVPGRYTLTTGDQASPQTIEHRHRGSPVWLDVPPRQACAVRLQLEEVFRLPRVLPDLAVHSRDLVRTGQRLSARIHNLGGAATEPFRVVLEKGLAGGWQLVATKTMKGLPAIQNFEPVSAQIEFELPPDTGSAPLRVRIDPGAQKPEITPDNNVAVLR